MFPEQLTIWSKCALSSVLNLSLDFVSAISHRDYQTGSVGGGSRSYWK